MEFKERLTYYQRILMQQVYQVEEKKELVEVIMVLIVGMLCGLYNPYQVSQELAINPSELYQELKKMSAYSWRELLNRIMEKEAVEKLKKYEKTSSSTQSRAEATISVDDSVVKRLGETLSYIWVWYSGQYKKVTKGQDLLGIVLKINGLIIPLRLVWVSKQGSGATSKPAILLKEMASLKMIHLLSVFAPR